MKKIIIAVALLMVVFAGVWVFRTVRDTLVRPIELVEGEVPACVVVWGEDGAGGDKKASDQRSDLTKALTDAGITPIPGVAMWIRDGGKAMRMGQMINPGDMAKARKLGGKTAVVSLKAQRAWIPAEAPTGKLAAAMATPRFMGSAMKKAEALGWTSYHVFIRMDGGSTRSALVRAPR